jgi:hypothetical protein
MRMWVNVWGMVPARRNGVGLVALALALGGCIDDFDDPRGYGTGGTRTGACTELCKRTVRCPGYGSESDCKVECERAERLVRQSGCERSYRDLIDCYEAADDICAAPDACSDEGDRFSTCFTEYCWNHEDECGSY